jgi:hypothetical protein
MTITTGRGKADQDIIRAIGYITDDKYIAAYFGVDVKRVNHLRAQVNRDKAKAEPVRQVKLSENAKPTSHYSGMNSDAERKWNANAKEGSAQLLKALLKFFANRERRLREQSNG